jgi:ferredoxin-type protein NapH
MVITYKNKRQTIQKASFAISLIVFAMAISGMNAFLQSTNPLAPLGGFLVLMCILTTAIIALPLGIIYKP